MSESDEKQGKRVQERDTARAREGTVMEGRGRGRAALVKDE